MRIRPPQTNVYVIRQKQHYMWRLYAILSAVGLEDRICTFEHSLEHLLDVAKRPVDWEAVDRKIEVMRKHSINLLKEALKR